MAKFIIELILVAEFELGFRSKLMVVRAIVNRVLNYILARLFKIIKLFKDYYINLVLMGCL